MKSSGFSDVRFGKAPPHESQNFDSRYLTLIPNLRGNTGAMGRLGDPRFRTEIEPSSKPAITDWSVYAPGSSCEVEAHREAAVGIGPPLGHEPDLRAIRATGPPDKNRDVVAHRRYRSAGAVDDLQHSRSAVEHRGPTGGWGRGRGGPRHRYRRMGRSLDGARP